MSLTLVLGGTRSGKSAHAEALVRAVAEADGLGVRYVGTAAEDDASMAPRLARHRARRPAAWETVVGGDDLGVTVLEGGLTLIDGLGGWIAGREPAVVEAGVAALLTAAERSRIVVVAEQAGEGLLPMDRVAREWLDLLGEAVQALSEAAERVLLVVAGRALELPAPGIGSTP